MAIEIPDEPIVGVDEGEIEVPPVYAGSDYGKITHQAESLGTLSRPIRPNGLARGRVWEVVAAQRGHTLARPRVLLRARQVI
jgi:hypothetical protein